MKRLCLLAILILSAPALLAQDEEIPAEKRIAIRQLLVSSGALWLGEQMGDMFLQQLTQSLRAARSDIPAQAFDILEEEVQAVLAEEMDSGNFEEMLYPIYHKYYSLEEIQQLLDFYSSPIGRKSVDVMPELTQESSQAGQAWGMALGPKINERIMRRFAEEGIELD